jgi:phosphoglycolate phosphatase-like HAD superfamily hydrolase
MIALLDLDGTLTDPKAGITRSIQFALDRFGQPVPEQDVVDRPVELDDAIVTLTAVAIPRPGGTA